jgi:NADH pyrophosphatase NudC (nudix superfamily)
MLRTPFEAFQFCLVCGNSAKNIQDNILKCTNCGYKHFINSAPAAGILLRNNNNRYLLTKRGIDPYKGAWDVAGGFIGLNESFEEAAARELDEELHITAPIEEIIGSAYLTYPYQQVDLPVLAIVGIAEISDQKIQVDDDVAEIAFFTLEELSNISMPYQNLQRLLQTYATKQMQKNTIPKT